jgi:hypothetical protein
MATIIQGPPDRRYAALEEGVSRGVENFFQERERAKKEQKFADAFRAINAAQSYDEAVKAMGLMDREILANPQALALLGEQIQMKFPPQEAVTLDTPEGIRTTAIRKGDVAGALAEAQASGGRLASETELERKRTMEDDDQATQLLDAEYKRELGLSKLELEERRTRAAELRAQAAATRAKAGKGPSEKDKEILRLSEILGGDTTRAMKIVYGLEETSIDPQTGEARVLDKTTGRVAVVPAENLQDFENVPAPKDGQGLWDAALAGTGPFSALRAASALPTAYMGVFEPKKTVESRQRLNLASNKLVRALRETRAFAEAKWIESEINVKPSVFVHPEVMRRRMVTLHHQLTLWKAQRDRDAMDPKLPSDERANSKVASREIQNFLSELAVPAEHLAGQEQSVEALPENVQRNYPEITFERWNRLSPAQKKRLMEAE